MSELPKSIVTGVPLPKGAVENVSNPSESEWHFHVRTAAGLAGAASLLRDAGFNVGAEAGGMLEADSSDFYIQLMTVGDALMYAVTVKNEES